MGNEAAGSWPEHFVYACNATRGMLVNVAPMLHAGRERLAGVVVFRNVRDPARPTQAEMAEAVLPSHRVRDYATRALGVAPERVRFIDGDPDLVAAWTGALDACCALAADWGCREVVYNFSGGRKPCTIGALLGLSRTPDALGLSFVSVGQAPFIVRRVAFGPGGVASELALPVAERLALQDYLASYGAPEIDRAGRMARETILLGQAAPGERILGLLSQFRLRPQGRTALETLQMEVTAQQERRRGAWTPIRLASAADLSVRPRGGAHAGAWPAFTAALASLGPVWASGGVEGARLLEGDAAVQGIEIGSQEAARFLGGCWLEAVLLARLRAAFSERNAVEIAAGVRVPVDEGGEVEAGEIDALILSDDTLDLVEAKAVTATRGLVREIEKLDARRKRLAGTAGRAWFVAPAIDRSAAQRSGAVAAAEAAMVRLYVGRDAVGAFVRDVVHLVAPSRR